MAIGKQYRLELVPEVEENSCTGCWFSEAKSRCPSCTDDNRRFCREK